MGFRVWGALPQKYNPSPNNAYETLQTKHYNDMFEFKKQQPDNSENPWKTHRIEESYKNPWIRITHRDVTNPSGGKGIYGVVHFKNVAVVSWAQIINKRNHLWEIRAEFTCPGDLTQPLSENRSIGHIVYSVSRIDIAWLRARALGHWVFETPHCSEYVAPYLFFIVAVIVNAL